MLASFRSRLRMRWWRLTNRATGIASTAFVHHTVDLCQNRPDHIRLGDWVHIQKNCWLNVPQQRTESGAVICIDARTSIGRGNVISARNEISIGEDCVTAPNVLIMDHGHEYSDVELPIAKQGTTDGGCIVIEPGCWIGFGAVIVCNRGILRIGRNSVVGANSVVTRDVEPFTVAVGSPARPARRYCRDSGQWLLVQDLLRNESS